MTNWLFLAVICCNCTVLFLYVAKAGVRFIILFFCLGSKACDLPKIATNRMFPEILSHIVRNLLTLWEQRIQIMYLAHALRFLKEAVRSQGQNKLLFTYLDDDQAEYPVLKLWLSGVLGKGICDIFLVAGQEVGLDLANPRFF